MALIPPLPLIPIFKPLVCKCLPANPHRQIEARDQPRRGLMISGGFRQLLLALAIMSRIQ